jgi:hypothetical protein
MGSYAMPVLIGVMTIIAIVAIIRWGILRRRSGYDRSVNIELKFTIPLAIVSFVCIIGFCAGHILDIPLLTQICTVVVLACLTALFLLASSHS